jgi:hypothetical protein
MTYKPADGRQLTGRWPPAVGNVGYCKQTANIANNINPRAMTTLPTWPRGRRRLARHDNIANTSRQPGHQAHGRQAHGH